jgi:hypothetical protein
MQTPGLEKAGFEWNREIREMVMEINRRALMGWMGFTGGSLLSAPWLRKSMMAEGLAELTVELPGPQTTPTRWERSAAQKLEQTRDITWLTHEPLNFLLRRGDHFDDEPEHYRRMLEPDNIRRMAAAGVTWGRIFFDKGFGLEYQKPHIEQAKKAADLMHQLGMRVNLYFGGTMFTEILYREVPEARDWEQRDQWNQWVPYGIQTFRHYACPNEPAWRDYMRRVLTVGIVDLGADEISFDNVMLQAEPKSCRCPRCQKAFTEFLRRRYPTREAMMRRFGLPDADWIRVNEWQDKDQPQGLTVLEDPVLQEWVRFRCESLARHANDLYDSVKRLNPKTAAMFNIKGVFSFNRFWTNAVYHPLYSGHLDMMSFDTPGYDARIDPGTGALVSQIRSYKIARRLATSCEEGFDSDLAAAVHMAFGYQNPICTPAPFGTGAHNVFTPLVEFFRAQNSRYYTGTDNVADVAVLRNWPSMAYSINSTYLPAALMEQVLIQYKVPFDLLFEEQLDGIGRYAAVILAGQECVSNAQAEQLLAYVRNGGTLVVAGNTGEFNEWHERRKTNPLLPARREGKGRIVAIAEIRPADLRKGAKARGFQDPEPGATLQRGAQIMPSDWVLPENHAEIFQSIVSSIPGGLSIATEAPLTTVMELLNRRETRETMAHFINFDSSNRIAPFAVTLRKQYDGAIKSVLCVSPERDDAAPLPFEEAGNTVKFTVPSLKLYAMVVVAQ